MTPMPKNIEELVERLREFEGSDALGNGDFSVCLEAATALEQAYAEIERLRTAGSELAEIIKTNKATIIANFPRREFGFLQDSLHKWNMAALNEVSNG